ncbi:hypothetical protein DFH11DRAFT_274831 [Phellopilus nigrolimitatus]|nr:hypothetical protein DFH11DRAFT_274831 [Phellopilus nigrolimitatus]
MTMLGGSRCSPILISSDDDDYSGRRSDRYYREESPARSVRAWMDHSHNSKLNFRTDDLPLYGDWRANNYVNPEPASSRQPRQFNTGADMEHGWRHHQLETGAFRGAQMAAPQAQAQASTLSISHPLKRKRSDQFDAGADQQPRVFVPGPHAGSSAAAVAPALYSLETDPFAGLSKPQRRKLRKRQKAEAEAAAAHSNLPPVPILPAETVLGWNAVHRQGEHATYDGPNWPGQTTHPYSAPQPQFTLSSHSQSIALDQSLVSSGLEYTSTFQQSFPTALPPRPTSSEPSSSSHVAAMECNMFALNSRLIGSYAPQVSGHGLFPLEPDQYVPHDPECSLVMENIPKKFRTLDFVLQWCKDTGNAHDPAPLHIDVMRKLGKALIEFNSRERAIRAFNSKRLVNNDGRGQITVYWYRPEGTDAVQQPGPLFDQPPQPAQTPPLIPPPPHSIHPAPPVRDIHSTDQNSSREDMEEGEIDEEERGNYNFLSTGLTPRPSPPLSPFSPKEHLRWLPKLINPDVESEIASTHSSAPHKAQTPTTHDRSSPIPAAAQYLPDVHTSGLIVAKPQIVESYPTHSESMTSVTDMELDSQHASSPVTLTIPSRDLRPPPPLLDMPPNFGTPQKPIIPSGIKSILEEAKAKAAKLREVEEAIEKEERKKAERKELEEKDNRALAPEASIMASHQEESAVDRLSELRQRVLVSKKRRSEVTSVQEPSTMATSGLANETPPSALTHPSSRRDIHLNSVPARPTTPSTPSTVSSSSTDSLLSKSSSVGSANTSVSVAACDAPQTDPISSSKLDDLATAFLQDIIGFANSAPQTSAERPNNTQIQVPLNSKIVQKSSHERLEQLIADMKQLMAHLGSAKPEEKGKILRAYREKERCVFS